MVTRPNNFYKHFQPFKIFNSTKSEGHRFHERPTVPSIDKFFTMVAKLQLKAITERN